MPGSASMTGDMIVRLAGLRRLGTWRRAPAPDRSQFSDHPGEVERAVRDRLYGSGRREVLDVRPRDDAS